MQNHFTYRIATERDLERLWEKDIARNPDEPEWVQWREEYLHYNKSGMATTYAVLCGDEPVGQITLITSTECGAVKGRPALCDGVKIANMNAFRIEKQYEGQGHISKLVRLAEQDAKRKEIEKLTIGVEAKETRNLAIYLHFGYTQFVMSEMDGDELVLYYGKEI